MHRSFVALVSLAVLGVAVAVSGREGPAEGLQVGFAAADVTPTVDPKGKPVYLAGFGSNRRATGVHDPLFARAVVFRDRGTRVAFVSVDVVGLFHDLVERVRKRLPGFTHVCVSSTHNHEGPDTMGLWGASPLQSGVDPDYLAVVERRIVEAVRAADAAAQPATARIGSVALPELLHDGRLPIVKHDDLVALVVRRTKDDRPAGLVVQWNCHPETLDSRNTLVSADYVGYTVKHLRER
ncbi:MAG: neutral/alkaline non-lysosomal ceramidase N-terminal domain-containing protein [Gemmataceae bacterium]